jgi:hypothetical protein
MSRKPRSRPGWAKWGHRLGFSYKAGNLRAELWPSWKRWDEPWEGEIWNGSELLQVLHAPDHWRGMDAVEETVTQLREEAA